MRNRLPAASLAVMAALVIGSCACDEEVGGATAARLTAAPAALSFGDRCNEGAYVEPLEVRNNGGRSTSVSVRLDGDHAVMFSVEPTQFDIPGLGTRTVNVTYAPSNEKANGVDQLGKFHQAELVLTYKGEDGETSLRVPINGTVANLPATPRISFECGEGVPACGSGPSEVPCCTVMQDSQGRSLYTNLDMGSPRVNGTTTLPLRIRNTGCGELTVSAISHTVFGDCNPDNLQLSGAEGQVVLPPTSGAASVHDIAFTFAPTRACTLNGNLTVQSTDPGKATTVAGLGGRALAALLEIDPATGLAFGAVTPGTRDEKTITLVNRGNLNIQVKEVTLLATDLSYEPIGGNSDFSIREIRSGPCSSGDVPDDVIGPIGGGNTYDMPPSDARRCGPDEVKIYVEYAPAVPANQDRAVVRITWAELGGADQVSIVRISGGASPRIITYPEMIVQFFGPQYMSCVGNVCGADSCPGLCRTDADCTGGRECFGATDERDGVCTCTENTPDCTMTPDASACVYTCGYAERVVEICNEGQALLEIFDVTVAESVRDYYTVDISDCAGGVDVGACCEMVVGFQDGSTGGATFGSLTIETNDDALPSYSLELESGTAENEPPVAAARYPEDPQRLRWLNIDAGESRDPDDPPTAPNKGIASYTWTLVSVPNNPNVNFGVSEIRPGAISPANPSAGCPADLNGGECIRLLNDGQQLQFMADAVGVYHWRLTVTDDDCDAPQSDTANLYIDVVIP